MTNAKKLIALNLALVMLLVMVPFKADAGFSGIEEFLHLPDTGSSHEFTITSSGEYTFMVHSPRQPWAAFVGDSPAWPGWFIIYDSSNRPVTQRSGYARTDYTYVLTYFLSPGNYVLVTTNGGWASGAELTLWPESDPKTPRDVIVHADSGRGSARAMPSTALPGREVLLIVAPQPGYIFSHWEELSGSLPTDMKNLSSTVAAFTMPSGDGKVQVMAVFKPVSLPGDWKYTDDGESITITGYTGTAAEIEIPAVINGKPVTKIGARSFLENYSLISVTIPDSVTTIGDAAFYGCHSLASITIPDRVTTIGVGAFYNCRSLTEITIPDSITEIGNGTFYGCYSLASITIPDRVTTIGVSAFSNCTGLTDITIPDSVTEIGNGAFYDCYRLASVTIPDSVTSIGNSTFFNCSSLTDITIPDSVTAIGTRAFEGCYRLMGITIPSSITAIGYGVFSNCSSLVDITIPNSVTTIGDYAFYYCSSLTDMKIPDSVTTVGGWAFSSCDSLTEITIPDSVTTIGHGAFSNCASLTDIIIPGIVTSIGDGVFYGCSNLYDVYFESATPPTVGILAFALVKPGARAIVPYGATAYGSEGSLWNGLIVTYADPVNKEATPDAVVGFVDELLTGLVPGAAYTVNGAAKTAGLSGEIEIEAGWFGQTVDIIKIGAEDSDAQELAIPARPEAPVGIAVSGTADGNTITGVNDTMEYKLSSGSSWTAVDGTTLSGLAAGAYNVRFRATGTAFAGESAGPFRIAPIPGDPAVTATGPATVEHGKDSTATYTLSMSDMPDVNAVSFTVRIEKAFFYRSGSTWSNVLGGFSLLSTSAWRDDGDFWEFDVVLVNAAKASTADLFELKLYLYNMQDTTTAIEFTNVKLATAGGGGYVPGDFDASVKTEFLKKYSLYDVNRDGIVDLLDISAALDAFMAEPGDANWNAACDVNGDGIIDTLDLVLIRANFTK